MHFISPTLSSVLCPQNSVDTALATMVSVAFSSSFPFCRYLITFVTPWAVVHQWDFPGKNTGVDCHFLLQDLPDPGIEPTSPALARRFFTTETPGKPFLFWTHPPLFPSPSPHLWLLVSTFTGFLIFYSLFNICVHHSPVITLPFSPAVHCPWEPCQSQGWLPDADFNRLHTGCEPTLQAVSYWEY